MSKAQWPEGFELVTMSCRSYFTLGNGFCQETFEDGDPCIEQRVPASRYIVEAYDYGPERFFMESGGITPEAFLDWKLRCAMHAMDVYRETRKKMGVDKEE